MARNRSRVLTDHDEIRRWAEQRNASPACARRTGDTGDIDMIRLDFPGYSDSQSVEHVEWNEWFQKFDESNLALVVQEQPPGGGPSNFNKLIGRETTERRPQSDFRASRHEGRRDRVSSRGGASRGRRSRRTASGGGRRRSAASSRASSRRSSSQRASSQRSSSQRAKRRAKRGEAAARTRRAAPSRTKSSGALSRGRRSRRAVSRSKSRRGLQSVRSAVRRSGTVAGRNRGRVRVGGRGAAATSSGRRRAKRNRAKVVRAAPRIPQVADNVIRMERGQGRRGPARVTKRASVASAGTARQSRGQANVRSRRRAA